MRTIHQIVSVLNRGDLEHSRSCRDVVYRYLAQSGVAYDAFIDQRLDNTELLVARHLWIDPMQLPQPNLFDTEIAQALFRLKVQIFGSPRRRPHIGPLPCEAGLSRDKNISVWMQRLSDQKLRYIGAVRICRIHKIDDRATGPPLPRLPRRATRHRLGSRRNTDWAARQIAEFFEGVASAERS